MLRQLIQHRRTIWLLAVRNVRDRYTGTLGGMLWAILNPLLLLLVFWVVFDVGLRFGAQQSTPFVLVLFCGLIPWMTFNETLTGATSSIIGRAYLVKKIAFPAEILPFTQLVSALITHGILLVILALLLLSYKKVPGAGGLLLLPYYLFAMCGLAAGLSFLLAAAAVFYRDIVQGLGIALNIWFWITPIVWPPEMMAKGLKPLLDYNPLAYVVFGYRDCLLSAAVSLPNLAATIYFWAIVITLWILGAAVFMRLKPAFADVL